MCDEGLATGMDIGIRCPSCWWETGVDSDADRWFCGLKISGLRGSVAGRTWERVGGELSNQTLFRGEPSSHVLGSSCGAAAAASAAAVETEAVAVPSSERADVGVCTDLGPDAAGWSFRLVGHTRRLMSLLTNCRRLLVAGAAVAEDPRALGPGTAVKLSQEGGRLLPWITGVVATEAVAVDQYWVAGGVPSEICGCADLVVEFAIEIGCVRLRSWEASVRSLGFGSWKEGGCG